MSRAPCRVVYRDNLETQIECKKGIDFKTLVKSGYGCCRECECIRFELARTDDWSIWCINGYTESTMYSAFGHRGTIDVNIVCEKLGCTPKWASLVDRLSSIARRLYTARNTILGINVDIPYNELVLEGHSYYITVVIGVEQKPWFMKIAPNRGVDGEIIVTDDRVKVTACGDTRSVEKNVEFLLKRLKEVHEAITAATLLYAIYRVGIEPTGVGIHEIEDERTLIIDYKGGSGLKELIDGIISTAYEALAKNMGVVAGMLLY